MSSKHFLQILLICFSFYYLVSCTTINNYPQTIAYSTIGSHDAPNITGLPNQMIVSFPADLTQSQKKQAQTDFVAAFNAKFNKNLVITNTKHCPCDTLELWETDQPIIIQGSGGLAGVQSPPPGGAGDGVRVNNATSIFPNFALGSFDGNDSDPSIEFKSIATLTPPINYIKNDGRPITIAIMDTGLDITKITTAGNDLVLLPSKKFDECPEGSWNFVGNNNKFDDDHYQHHGTGVTQLLLDGLSPQNVKILALKVLDDRKLGSMFDVLCAINYAIKKKVDAVNMSLGYYGFEDKLFKKYMKALKDNNIWVFAAAGNENQAFDNLEKSTHSDPALMFNPRNLDTRMTKFYPACFTEYFNNIITVTSTDPSGNICPTQNFSSKYVNVGIKTDEFSILTSPPTYCGFYAPNTANRAMYLTGTSFATPIFAGKFLKIFTPYNTSVNIDDLIKNTAPIGTGLSQSFQVKNGIMSR